MEEQEFYSKLDHSIQQAKEGKIICQNEGESIEDFINRMLPEQKVEIKNEVQI